MDESPQELADSTECSFWRGHGHRRTFGSCQFAAAACQTVEFCVVRVLRWARFTATTPDQPIDIDAMDAHETMSNQALNSEVVRKGLKEILLGPAGLYESLRGEPSGTA